jgi:hypothetical protein
MKVFHKECEDCGEPFATTNSKQFACCDCIEYGELQDSDPERDTPEDTPSLENCDDWGTGEGKYHGRI